MFAPLCEGCVDVCGGSGVDSVFFNELALFKRWQIVFFPLH